ncbi:uncharacterized protein LACBIDRAFT_299668 [Laccaria bicolor S238N-H82]|uniref:Predicted protein n=1 Tax=Laccaria bicolor (strain S238N-H82 / ATCC MYA-4686) TaxID=486041 RepID=B0DF45_LACBS|nr:uncharacterized protein LACBIDRAFT_299668 [Laccaria bicolor S238N-H82]EDR06787.1 predicted protein [Laccaria bicolor S238N-H82]|eukprot:XP_001882634.1 predicted protein [Laccaria bicolor S238N-H82]
MAEQLSLDLVLKMLGQRRLPRLPNFLQRASHFFFQPHLALPSVQCNQLHWPQLQLLQLVFHLYLLLHELRLHLVANGAITKCLMWYANGHSGAQACCVVNDFQIDNAHDAGTP